VLSVRKAGAYKRITASSFHPARHGHVLKAKLRFLCPIATVPEPGSGVISGDDLKGFGNGTIQSFGGARFGGAQVLFELRPGMLDRVRFFLSYAP